LKLAAVNLSSDMLLQQSRCPKCTLPPPCKHYSTLEEMISDVSHFIAKPQFKEHLSPKKREIIFRTLREYKHEIDSGTFNSKP
jgi:hypothetical protein